MAKIEKSPTDYLIGHSDRIKKIELFLYYGTTRHFGPSYYDRFTDKGYMIYVGGNHYINGEKIDLEDVAYLIPVIRITISCGNFFQRLLGHTKDLILDLHPTDIKNLLEGLDTFDLEDWLDFIAEEYEAHLSEVQGRSNTLFKQVTIYNK